MECPTLVQLHSTSINKSIGYHYQSVRYRGYLSSANVIILKSGKGDVVQMVLHYDVVQYHKKYLLFIILHHTPTPTRASALILLV